MDYILTNESDVRASVARIFKDRISSAPLNVIESISQTKFVTGHVWFLRDYVVLGVLPPKQVIRHQKYSNRFGSPYPGLIETESRPAMFHGQGINAAVINMSIHISRKSSLLRLPPGGSFYFEKVRIFTDEIEISEKFYDIDLVFVVRKGNSGIYELLEKFDSITALFISRIHEFVVENV